MHLDMSIAENLFLGRWPKKGRFVDWKKLDADARKYMEMVGLTDVEPSAILRQLGASQQQLVSIARALSKDPQILVLDEPTSPLTSREADKLFDILYSLRNRGIACILITHKWTRCFAHADRVTVIRDGKSISRGPLSETDSNQIIKDMDGREITKVDIRIGYPSARRFWKCATFPCRIPPCRAERSLRRPPSHFTPARFSALPGWWALAAANW